MRAIVLSTVSVVALYGCVLLCSAAHVASAERARVAVVGAGAGGAAAAHWLSQLEDAPEVHVFECCVVGGRMREFEYQGQPHELGASIIHATNLHALHLAKAVGLTQEPVVDAGGGGFAIWDGSAVVFQARGGWWDALRMAARWGTAALRYSRLALEAGRRWLTVYELQAEGQAFPDPRQLLDAMRLGSLTQISAAQLMQAELRGVWGFGAKAFQRELAGAVNRVNYNQGNERLNGLAGLVSYLPAAAPAVWRIKEGNALLALRLINASGAALHAPCAVTGVAPATGGRHKLSTADDCTASVGRPPPPAIFDAVVLATPLELSGGIQLTGYDPPLPPLPPRQYQATICSYVRGWLIPGFFNVTSLPDGDVLVTDDAATPFTVIARQRLASDGGSANDRAHPSTGGADSRPLWKLFSTAILKDDLLAALFTNATVVAQQHWFAYPQFSPPEALAPFELAPGLYYNNGLESGASAVEVALVAARNNVLLVQQHLRRAAAAAAAAATQTESQQPTLQE